MIMGLKFQVTKLEEVPEVSRGLYRPEGNVFVLDVDGVVPKDRLDEFRNNNISLQQQLDKFKNVDPSKYADLVKLQTELEEGKLIKEGKLDEVLALRTGTMKTTYETQLTTLNTQLASARSQLGVVMIDNVIKSAAIKLGVIPEAVDDVVLRAKGVYHLDDAGAPVPKDAQGQVIYGKDGKSPMPVEEWLTALKGTAKHLFLGNSGGGANGGGRNGTPNMATLNATQKIAVGLSNGQGGRLLANLPNEAA
jgi:hypothetical protein